MTNHFTSCETIPFHIMEDLRRTFHVDIFLILLTECAAMSENIFNIANNLEEKNNFGGIC